MAKGDDALAKKKNKAIRKRNRRAGVDTTEFAEGVKAHKRRRKLGTRRVCEVCCFLPVSLLLLLLLPPPLALSPSLLLLLLLPL
jgi:hypothetical protein